MEWLPEYLFFQISWALMIAYLPLQIYTGLRWRGGWRIAALVPLALMVPVFGVTAAAIAEESNLAGIFLICTAPVATIYLLVLFAIRLLVTPRPNVGKQVAVTTERNERTSNRNDHREVPARP